MGLRAIVAGLLWLAATASAETVTWEADLLATPGRQILARGVKDYSPTADIVVTEGRGRDGAPFWSKALALDEVWALSASVYREPRVNGFGLVIVRKGEDGFSWDWFEREGDDAFVKLQGDGRVRVRVRKGPGYEELESVEFLDDVVLRHLDDMSKPPGTHSHELVVRKGSVLKLP